MNTSPSVSLKDSVYPGHPVCIAVAIMERYASFEQATQSNGDAPPAALVDQAIRGAGGNVYAGLDLLKHSLAGHDELALAAAQRYWMNSAEPFGADRVAAGDEQARAAIPRLQELLARWPAKPNS